MSGIVAYGTYVPFHRLDRAAISAALGEASGEGQRAVAAYDEDTTTMAVEAGRIAVRGLAPDALPEAVHFATADPAYLDKTNAATINAALALEASTAAYDMVGSVRSSVGALRAALDSPGPALAVAADVRVGLPGGADEREGGDGAAAFVCGPGTADAPVLAERISTGSATGEFLDRWRVPGRRHSEVWEERFGDFAYAPLAERALDDALSAGGVDPEEVGHLVVTGTQVRAVRSVVKASGCLPEALVDDLSATVGNTGAAHPGMLLASALDRAGPGALVVLVVLADGADALVFRTTDALAERRPTPTVADQISSGRGDLPYASFLTWRGLLVREPPRRPDPSPPAAPPALRSEDWKFGFVAARCDECGARNLPPQRVCRSCRAVDQMSAEPLADAAATIATFTIDRLAPSLERPLVAAVLDFDGGGRYRCELTDVDPDAVAIGDRVEMTFRRLSTVDGVHNYFWKARPKRKETA